MLWKAFWSMTAVMKLRKSAGSPMRMEPIWSDQPVLASCCHSESGTYRREAAEHFWPWNSKAPRTVLKTSCRRSAEACAKMKSLPPVSPTRRGIVFVTLEVFADGLPHLMENGGAAGEVDARQGGMAQGRIADLAAGAGKKLITPGGRPASSSSCMIKWAE